MIGLTPIVVAVAGMIDDAAMSTQIASHPARDESREPPAVA
jgi:hypothetical protein